MTDADRRDPYTSFNFRVAVDGVSIGEFSQVSGLTAEGDAIDLKAANLQPTVRKLVGLHKYANITLKSGYMRDQSLWNWRKGQRDRRKITISVMNKALKRLQHWHLENAWVNKIEGPSLKASANEVPVETLEIAHEGLRNAITSWPSACSVGISLLKHEPSTQRPWAKTMLGFCL